VTEYNEELKKLEIQCQDLKNLHSSINIDSFNLSIPMHYRAKIKAAFIKHNTTFSYIQGYQTVYLQNNYKIYTQATTTSIIVTFKGITSYKPIQRKYIFELIKELSFIPHTHLHHIDICIDFRYNDSYKKHLTKNDISFHHNGKQPFIIKKYKFMKTAPYDEVEQLIFYLNNIKCFSNDEENTTYIHHKMNRANAKYNNTRGLGKEYFKSYYYDKQVKAKSKGYTIPYGVVRLEYSFKTNILNLLDIHSPREIYKKLPAILNKINNSVVIEHIASNTQLCWCHIEEDRNFIQLLSFFWKEKTKLPEYIEKEDNENMHKLNILKDIKDGLTNQEICEKYNFTNEKPITKLRKLL